MGFEEYLKGQTVASSLFINWPHRHIMNIEKLRQTLDFEIGLKCPII